MKFRISRVEPIIRWPEKCVWCGSKPTMKYEDSAKGVIGGGFLYQKYGKVEVEYPVCKRHGLWLSLLQLAYPISIWGMVLGWMIHYSLSLFFGAVFLWNLFLRPISIMKITGHFYTMKIRNEDYAREFALLNSFDPL